MYEIRIMLEMTKIIYYMINNIDVFHIHICKLILVLFNEM